MYLGVNLNSEQSLQMEHRLQHIQADSIAKSQLQAVLSEVSDAKLKGALQSVWKEESGTDRQQLFEDQAKCS